MEFSGSQTRGTVVVGFGFFKIMFYFPRMSFPVALVSDFRVIILVEYFNTTCLYEKNLGGTEVLSVEFNLMKA